MGKSMDNARDIPKLSVIVPAFNAGEYLEACLESILAQTFRDFELILIDDGSKDNTPDICDKYANKDGRVRVFHQENAGLVTTRKRGISHVESPYVTFVDADDYIDPDMYERMMQKTDEHDPDVVTCSFIREYPKHSRRDKEYVPSGLYEGEALKDLKKELLWSKDLCKNDLFKSALYTSYWNKIFKTDLLRPVLEDAKDRLMVGEDFSVIIPFLMDTARVFVMGDFYPYHYRMLKKSRSHSFKKEYFSYLQETYEKLSYELIKRDLSEDAKLLSYYMLRVVILGIEKAARSKEIGIMGIERFYARVIERYETEKWVKYADPRCVDDKNRRLAMCICSGNPRGLRFAIIDKYIKMKIDKR